MPEIYPCPCGGEAQLVTVRYGEHPFPAPTRGLCESYKIVCTRCGYETAEYALPKYAKKFWNRFASRGGAA